MVKMGSSLNKVFVILVVAMLVFFQGSRAYSFCKMSEEGLNACMPSVSTKQNPVDPSPKCCKALSGADLGCLCSYKASPVLPSLGINSGLAMGLPAKCGISPPANCA